MLTLFYLLVLVLVVLMVASLWKIFTKAGQPGWASIIPIYNFYIWLKVVGKPWWYLLLLFIPYVNYLVSIWFYYLLAKSFGKGVGFTVGMVLLPFIFFPVLAFGDAKYIVPQAAVSQTQPVNTAPVGNPTQPQNPEQGSQTGAGQEQDM